jgi:Zinc finger C-x8-C-x5-C-x3-H type (and similar)
MPPKPTPPINGVRHVDVRVPKPEHGTMPSAPPGFSGGLRPSGSRAATTKRTSSPYTFVPVSPSLGSNDLGRPPMSPFDIRKTTPSPALTATTADLSERSFSSRTSDLLHDPRLISPLTIYEGEVCGAASPMTTPSPAGSSDKIASASPTQQQHKTRAKSPFVQKDNAGRKQRVKTELCMHIERGSTCPFGKDCVFAHSEEELRLTKLLDLVCAGMVDGETFRAKPCENWVSTGSW